MYRMCNTRGEMPDADQRKRTTVQLRRHCTHLAETPAPPFREDSGRRIAALLLASTFTHSLP